MARWQSYSFPGNVRELRNIVIRLSTKYSGQKVSLEQLEDELDTGAGIDELTNFFIPGDSESQKEIVMKHLQGQQNFSLDHTLKAVGNKSYV